MKKVLYAAAIVVVISCCCLASACSDLGDAYDGTPYTDPEAWELTAEDGSNDFVISRVKVYANDDFAPYINSEEDFDDMKGAYIAIYAVCGVVVAALAAGLIAATASYLKKKKRARL